jgi:transcription termination/antitermination protein NusG
MEQEKEQKQKSDGKAHWYAIHTYAGYENAVVRNLKQRIESLGMEDKIFDVVVPTKKVVKVKRNKRVEEDERIYPGYVLVNMIVTDDSWYVVRNTPRVTGFVGTGTHPVPLNEKEIKDLFSQMDESTAIHDIDLVINETVSVIDGPFKEMEGRVSDIDRERGKVKVLVSMFGRETPVELDFLQIKRL